MHHLTTEELMYFYDAPLAHVVDYERRKQAIHEARQFQLLALQEEREEWARKFHTKHMIRVRVR